eukprot:Tamp_15692.p1 GENE.Tamp_15692~~Tamp_15692.p1  ORF type:complete len:372 (+),score=70.21 Tamp_15692:165-1280(+)
MAHRLQRPAVAWPLILMVNLAGWASAAPEAGSQPLAASRRGALAFLHAPRRLASLPGCGVMQARAPAITAAAPPLHLPPRTAAASGAAGLAGVCIRRAFCRTRLSSSAVDTNADPPAASLDAKEVNFAGLKKETGRNILRAFKKAGKAEERLRKALEKESGPADDLEAMEQEVQDTKARVADLNRLEEQLSAMKNIKDPAFPQAWALATQLGVSDKEPPRPDRGPKKPKGKQPPPRKCYWTYTAADGTEIRVGRGAKDNDELTLKERDNNDWWLHVSGCPGSHVVIRNTAEEIPRETVMDAAVLATKFSQAPPRSAVSLTRCRDVTKPPGAKPGLVQLRGAVETIKVDLKKELTRLDRLLPTRDPPLQDGA